MKKISVEQLKPGDVFLRDGDDAPLLVVTAEPNVPVQKEEPFETYTVVARSLRNCHDSYHDDLIDRGTEFRTVDASRAIADARRQLSDDIRFFNATIAALPPNDPAGRRERELLRIAEDTLTMVDDPELRCGV